MHAHYTAGRLTGNVIRWGLVLVVALTAWRRP